MSFIHVPAGFGDLRRGGPRPINYDESAISTPPERVGDLQGDFRYIDPADEVDHAE